LCSKRKLPPLDLSDIHSWSEVEQSVSNACEALEALSLKEKKHVPGFTGKLKQAFQKLCRNAGTGTTLINLVPTDSYCSILCGGLKIIFQALQETDRYREEIYNTLEELPFVLNDNASFLSLNFADEDLHRRAASIYAAIYGLMEVIIDWFLKRSLGESPHPSNVDVLLTHIRYLSNWCQTICKSHWIHRKVKKPNGHGQGSRTAIYYSDRYTVNREARNLVTAEPYSHVWPQHALRTGHGRVW
jgi:hypothetical protein